MAEIYKQKTILVNKFEANQVIKYLGETYGRANSGTFDIKDDGKIKIQSQGDRVEVMCDCSKGVINKLENMIEQNE